MKTRAIATALLLAFSPMVLPAPAFAQDDPLTVQARARFKEGVEFFDKGQYENARASFLQAYALKSHPAVLLNLAQSCLRANHALEAVKYFQQYLKQVQNPTPQQRHDAEAGLEEARNKVGHVDIVAPQGTEVSIVGGDRLGNAPFGEGVDLDPGSYTFKSRATDGSSETVKITVAAGQRQQVKFGQAAGTTTPPVPTTPPPVPTTNANGTTTPDGTTPPDNGQNPPPDTGVTPKHTTSILSPPKTMIPVYIGGGVAVAGAVTAIILGFSKGSAQNAADSVDAQIRTTAKTRGISATGICSTAPGLTGDFKGACAQYKSDLDAVNGDATGANIGIAVAIVGVVFGAGWYLFAPKKDADEGTLPNATPAATPPPASGYFTVVPMIGGLTGGANGVGVSGRF